MVSKTCPVCGYNPTGLKGADPINLSGTKTYTTTCPACGHQYETPLRRHSPQGTGAFYAIEMTKLGRAHCLCLTILNTAKAYNFNSGLPLHPLWLRIRQFCLDTKQRVPSKAGIGGRLSELQGLGFVRSARNQVVLEDSETMSFRHERNQQRWYLTRTGSVSGAN
jgi:hypothetical protein